MMFTVYRDGVVLRTGSCADEHVQNQAREGERVVSGYYPGEDYYFDGDTPILREPLHVKIDGLTLSNLPIGTIVSCEGVEYPPINDGVAEFEFNLPGDYVVEIKPPRHQHGRVTLTV